MRSVDLNCDCGEGFGAYAMGDDAAMLDIVTSANVACGFHGGDPEIMAATFAAAKAKGVAIGAHPGFPDLWGFGRRKLPFTTGEIERLVAYQIGAALALAAYAGHRLSYVKAHGALSNIAMVDESVALAIARAVKSVDPRLGFLAVSGTKLEAAGAAEGLAVAREIYADRAYTDDGLLLDRSFPGAVLHDPAEVAERVLAMVEAGAVISVSGKRAPLGVDSICVHGDSPNAVAMAKAVRLRLEAAGVALAPFAWG
ncbi:5-oxoprolinase subunit PxpA [Methylocapsa polymorpha]|uniref:5-oxoprolinase subunit A n=1 Tax=Methylocapsa polymorpha TaxID=3080828 RepID=A0ABZ0HSZ9_9HYPH|nr:5-oxoprolinase subunit PxpA [Methylocapsa sp. RX1]